MLWKTLKVTFDWVHIYWIALQLLKFLPSPTTIFFSLTWWLRYYLTKMGQQKKETLIFKKRIETPLYTCIGVAENFMQSLSAFLLFFDDKKEKLLKALLKCTEIILSKWLTLGGGFAWETWDLVESIALMK